MIYIIREDTRAEYPDNLAIRGPFFTVPEARTAAARWREQYTYPAMMYLRFSLLAGSVTELPL